MTMTTPVYADRYPDLAMRRRDGILEVRFTSDGGEFIWGGRASRDVPEAFAAIAQDPENRIVILTGTGDTFMNKREAVPSRLGWLPEEWDLTRRQNLRLMNSLLDIEAPIIAAVNGPVTVHPEIPVLSDIVLAAEQATFQEDAHLANGCKTVPADGMHIVWPHLLGMNRGRYFLMMSPEIGATEALRLGLVSEVLPAGELLPRAWEIATQLAANPPLTLRHTRIAFTMQWKRLMNDYLGYGLALEGLAKCVQPAV